MRFGCEFASWSSPPLDLSHAGRLYAGVNTILISYALKSQSRDEGGVTELRDDCEERLKKIDGTRLRKSCATWHDRGACHLSFVMQVGDGAELHVAEKVAEILADLTVVVGSHPRLALTSHTVAIF